MRIVKSIFRWLLAIGFVAAGINHFINPNFYRRMMPPVLPWHLFLIYLSGALEIFFGGLLLIPRFTRFAAYGLIALLIAVFPANIYMAQNAALFPEFSPLVLYVRLPFQFVLMVWAFWLTREAKKSYKI
ncbi:MAG TPA: DoxX family membrane protein [Pyrinomonadaceae bacterium]|jgi:uncharacterized membrane protein